MKVAITHANIFIDLIKLNLLDCLFKLGVEIHTTREVYDQLNQDQKSVAAEFFQSGVLLVYNFSFEQLHQINELEVPKGLELADRTVYYYATIIKAIILSGDRKLKNFCSSKKLHVNGILWLFDEFLKKKLITYPEAVIKLEKLMSFNDRLPGDECEIRLNKWRNH